jgi:hypothetical protein
LFTVLLRGWASARPSSDAVSVLCGVLLLSACSSWHGGGCSRLDRFYRQARARAGRWMVPASRAWHIVIVIVRIGSSFSFPGGGKAVREKKRRLP